MEVRSMAMGAGLLFVAPMGLSAVVSHGLTKLILAWSFTEVNNNLINTLTN